jgi:hypothetical protein
LSAASPGGNPARSPLLSPDVAIIAADVQPALDVQWAAGPDLAGPAPADMRRIDRRLIVRNTGPTARVIDVMADVVPELVDAMGVARALPGGRNRGAPPAPLMIAPGGSAEIDVRASLRHSDGGIDWRGDDGLGGRWDGADFSGRYRLRVRVAGSASPALSLVAP